LLPSSSWRDLLVPPSVDPDAVPVTGDDADDLGPDPRPSWLVVDDAVEVDLGTLKSGKEADVHVVRRTAVDPRARLAECLLAVKRYRPGTHHHAGYRAGREALGRFHLQAAGGWAPLEFGLLAHLWSAGVSVPYPVSRTGDELVMELIGDQDTGVAAPRLASHRPADRAEVADLWQQARSLVLGFADAGVAHGDLSAYNLLVHAGRLVAIDVPQAVDLVANPMGLSLLQRDCTNLVAWFRRRGLSADEADPDALLADALGVLPWA
jgi:RIO kinase 1